MITATTFERIMSRLKVPNGFTLEKTTEPKWGNTGGWLVYILKSNTVELKFNQYGDGSTNFMIDGQKWHTFDAIGVSPSFSFIRYDGKALGNINKIVAKELKRVEERLNYYKTALSVPGTAFTVQPDELAKMKAKLQNGESVSFMPSGFGAGFTFSSHRLSRWYKSASQAQCEFFKCYPLYVEQLDCD